MAKEIKVHIKFWGSKTFDSLEEAYAWAGAASEKLSQFSEGGDLTYYAKVEEINRPEEETPYAVAWP